uniref:U16-Liphistoxin-Lth1c_1 n=1 Tax=Liphistius thaleban TaxID=1905330 RepID=A0A4Q8K5H7_9ARAC
MAKEILPKIFLGVFLWFFVTERTSAENAQGISFSPCQATKLKMMLESAMLFLNGAQNFTETILVDEDKGDEMSICRHPMDCEDILHCGKKTSGIYRIWPINRIIEGSVSVYCDMETDGGGWTVFQRRGDFGQAKDFFYKNWEAYKKGFGTLEEDFWLGNDLLFAISNQRLYSLRIDLEDFEGEEKYAFYDSFWIDGEKCNYPLYINTFNGTAGDSLSYHNGSQFTTKDQDNDVYRFANCAHHHKGGWWYKSCHNVNINGLYRRGKYGSGEDGVEWRGFIGTGYSHKDVVMKIKPLLTKTLQPNK